MITPTLPSVSARMCRNIPAVDIIIHWITKLPNTTDTFHLVYIIISYVRIIYMNTCLALAVSPRNCHENGNGTECDYLIHVSGSGHVNGSGHGRGHGHVSDHVTHHLHGSGHDLSEQK